MAGCIINTSNRHIVHKIEVDEAKLREIARALGLTENEIDQFITDTESIHIYRNTKPTPGAP